ncbi:hypothetical protein [Neobacillus kokaensis]|uniref:Protein kinase domain-containing protein n=1 Tax=Neobacillus kokaensis TaxID=2759023 RepID=A0ABQ3N4F7_9BACI|nr:hypothetical protein [Neobacillus kokaensis]GHH98878.1 hypothetical protein AM1BK_24210 [Neobacillus kokaensis]
MPFPNEKENSFLTINDIDAIDGWISKMKENPLRLPSDKRKLAQRTLNLPYNIIGHGFNRMVYDLGSGYVLKIAFSEIGLICNTQEHNLYNISNPKIRNYLCPVLAKGDGWIVMKKMERKASINIENLEKLSRLSLLFLLNGIIPVDLRLANIALTDDNQMVVIDYGLFTTTPLYKRADHLN